MIKLQAGDRIKVTYKERRTLHVNEYDIVCALPGKNFIVVTNGVYKDTIDRLLVEQGKVKLELIKKHRRSGLHAG